MLPQAVSIGALLLHAGKNAFGQTMEAAANDASSNSNAFEMFMSDNYTKSCIQTNAQDMCRYNADCCSKLCTAFDPPSPKCIENTPENHKFDSFATSPARPDFTPNKFAGMERWRDKVAVVTGAASGMGFALAKRLCMEGMVVVGVDMNEAGVKKTADFCPPGKYNPFTADLRREQDIVNLFKSIDQKLGRVDVLINNAGVSRKTEVMDVSSEALRSLMDTNLLAPILCTREALKLMTTKNITSGYIMFTNSIAGSSIHQHQPGESGPNYHIYEATKHALKVVREGLRQELRAKGSRIRVGEVSPASVITNIAESSVPRDQTDKAAVKSIYELGAKVNKLDRLSPDDIAEAFVYMLQAPERMDINTILVQNVPK